MSLVQIASTVGALNAQQPARRKYIDPVVFREHILRNVYRPDENSRMIYKIRSNGYSYGGVVSGDVGGCSYRCDYCWVHENSLSGGGPLIEAKRKRGEKLFYTPEEFVAELVTRIERWRRPSVQITGGETFLTPRWTLDVIRLLSEYFETRYPHSIQKIYRPGVMWIDAQGFDLLQDRTIFPELEKYRDHVRLLISAKAHPDDFSQRTGVDQKHADDAFKALERAWQYRIIANPQMLDNLFRPETMEWFVERLQKIHPNAPRVLEFDHFTTYPFLPGGGNVARMKKRGFRFGKGGDIVPRNVALAAWQETLARHYGRRAAMPPYPRPLGYFDVDTFPQESIKLIRRWIFNTPGLAKQDKP